jgi:hypothetical protein
VTTKGQRIAALKPGQAFVLEKVPAGGSLEARRLGTGGVQFYWRHTQDKRTERVPIGNYDSGAPPKSLQSTVRGYSIAAALNRARELAKLNRDTPGGLRAERARVDAAARAEHHAKTARAKFTLRALCGDYCGWLKKQGKTSHSDARGIFGNHLLDPYPDLAETPAAEVEKREIVTALRRLTEAGKTTTARKLRSYLRAAYSCAVKADSDATLPAAFIGYKITTNPVEATAAIKGQADKNPLSAAELRQYWKALRDEPGVIGAALRLHVVTGGQRTAQLVRLRDTDVSRFTLKMLDPKGKRSVPRAHVLPVTNKVSAELALLPKKGHLLSTDGGETPMHPTSMSTWAAEVAERAEIEDFQLKRVRSGIETILAEAGVSLHIRGQLQSHGIGGVQATHYDSHDYIPEKREALAALYPLLVRSGAKKRTTAKNVTALRRAPR